MPLHYLAWEKALSEWGCAFDENLFYAWGGKPTRTIISELNGRNGLKMPIEIVAQRKEALYFELLPRLKAIPEVRELIEAQHGRLPFAVVSGGRRSAVTRTLTALGLLEKFDIVVGADDYTRGKPAPDGFLLAAARLGVEPEDCLVFEDTGLGIEAATAAGMASVLVPRPLKEAHQ
jgi:HAD superfamily hydrolase (TIGR01509 family)